MTAEIVSNNHFDVANKITPVDLFLLDRWDLASQKSVEEQRTELFREYVALGNSGRWRYHSALKERTFAAPSASQIAEILNRVRGPKQRRMAYELRGCGVLYLRTFYSENPSLLTTINDDGIRSITQANDRLLVLDDAIKYNYGDEWWRILDEFPEAAENRALPVHPDTRSEKMDQLREQLAADQDADEENVAAQLDWEKVSGTIILQDEESVADEHLRYLWLDEYGEIMRGTRCNVEECESLGLLRGRDVEFSTFERADVAESDTTESDGKSESDAGDAGDSH